MNKKRNTYSLLLWLSALMLFSCSQEELPGADGAADGSGIVFRVTLPDAGTRSTATTVADIRNAGFHVSAFRPEDDANGELVPYFAELSAKPSDEKNGSFSIFDQSSEQVVWPTTRHGKRGTLKFFAFYPSREVMRQSAGEEPTSEFFELKNYSKKNGSTVTYDYRMEKFKVNKDISRHIDFVTATAVGSKRDNGENGVALAFEHQLSRVTLQAWGNTPNDIEIAGVRIDCATTESDFDFNAQPKNLADGDATRNGRWIGTQVKSCVEYIFREGDAVVKIGNGSHTSAATAVSIMGSGEGAMVIPADNKKWNYTKDAANTQQGLYFSVLLRVKEDNESKTLVYPYVIGGNFSSTIPTDAMNVIFLSINSENGKVMKRVYRNKENHQYYIDPGLTEVYNLPEGEEIRNYGWAAIPLTDDYRWKPGYQYTYTLDYSVGVGVHAPDDPLPGNPIISRVLVGVTEDNNKWPKVVDNFTEGSEADITGDIIIG